MPERKRIPPEYGRIDATAEYRTELESSLEALYPRIRSYEEAHFRKFKARETAHCSFFVNTSQPGPLDRELLILSLKHAADKEDAAYSHHGAQHETFNESTSKIIDALNNNQQSVHFHTIEGIVDTEGGKLEVGFKRLVINSPKYQRTSYQPAPHYAALELKKKIAGGGSLDKEVRKITVSMGSAFGLLVCFYLGLDRNEITKIYDNPQFRKNIRLKDKQSKFIYPKRIEDQLLLKDLESKLTVVTDEGIYITFSSDAYRSALETLTNYNWLTEKDVGDISRFGFRSQTTTAQARAVLIGANEYAQKLANPNFTEPVRSYYIEEKFGSVTTSQVRTSFLIIS